MNCYKVKGITTNSLRNTICIEHKLGIYLNCKDGFIYVLAESIANIEKIIPSECIESIEFLGPGYGVDR